MADKPIKAASTGTVKSAEMAASTAPAKASATKGKPIKVKPATPPRPVAKPASAAQAAVTAEPAVKPVATSQETPIADAAAVVPDLVVTAPAEKAAPRVSIKELKEKIMAAKPTVDTDKITETVTAAFSDMQGKAKAAYEKGTAAMTDMTEFTKGNVEAVVESGKILATGMQDMGKTAVDEAKSAYEVATADIKEMAAVKSPTELLQLQGKIARRNFDALVAASSKNSELMMKLASDVFAPISGRVNLAVEKISKAA